MNRPYSAKDHLPGELYSAAQVRELDALAISQIQQLQPDTAGFELMSRAGEAAFASMLERWPEESSVCVLAGPGNNGGDAYVLAALACHHGLDVVFYTLGDHTQLSPAASQAREMALQAGVEPQAFRGELVYEGQVIIDGLLGTGLNKVVDGDFATAIQAVNVHFADVLALDLPSGLHADSGRILGCAIQADLTITFIGVKQGLLTSDGPDVSGDIAFASLAVDPLLYHQVPAQSERISWDRLERLGQRLSPRRGNSHKGEFGHVMVVGGDHGMGGAVAMAVEAAGRCGSGLIRCATRTEHVAPILVRRPEAMVKAVESGLELQPLLEQSTVIACGPGLGQSSWSELLLQQVLNVESPLVLDADGLNLLASPGWKRSFSERDVVLTPHPGEAARLLGNSIEQVQADRFSAVRELAKTYDAVVVLKGQGTLIAKPDGHVALCTDGNPGMACGGMGDVLTGVIAALLAQGMSPWQAARYGVCIHSGAADLAAAENGQRGLLATDLMNYLRELMN
ncbi:NAD(P)H-hydrate dehydratase [Bacterioplanoides sp. SCSIO 12839]|uniref:NAD(P)H-hydrate dehydratase n=1 Tax=Bacterioplanoides sp. SCSIO 12839 TaxID=2829569 RepID=UPI00210260D2|nr:NAD(P)H-hydrate dehydratase [Bacterioplanoides sp. SCSIO 12839]UTW47967.1 NAD(P)H-hydrate dehydratase [Bacterioplanoides sp. SCSIO 12839]